MCTQGVEPVFLRGSLISLGLKALSKSPPAWVIIHLTWLF